LEPISPLAPVTTTHPEGQDQGQVLTLPSGSGAERGARGGVARE